MPGIAMIIHSPALFLRIAINVATVVAAISVTAAGISVGVVVAKLAAQSASTGSSNPLFDTTVVLQSSSSLVFNRIIQPYEFDSYYNTTQTLIDLTGELNEYLSGKFPTTFIKAYTYGISLYPQKTTTRRRRRRQNCMCTIGSSPQAGCPRCGTTSMPSQTNQGIHTTMSSFASTASTMLYSTFDTMTTNSENANHCNISLYYDGTVQPALIYLNGTLYFNSTQDNKPDPTVIIDALASFDPVIILIDKCLQKSPAESTFNSALSTVQPLSVVDGDASVLNKNNTYSLALVSLTNSVTTPQLSTMTTITTTTTTVTQSTTPLFG
ncbi:unnamed protein product [Adineta steineri]|uniref:Transmembrane protein n=2 Tax=Adineta steineri TaxID=433720 RepID=A0A815GY95_9BILA|nr:unnamed protein product [Adineta steineri]CAF1595221.1 unnamed protein product [Adineta steineri]